MANVSDVGEEGDTAGWVALNCSLRGEKNRLRLHLKLRFSRRFTTTFELDSWENFNLLVRLVDFSWRRSSRGSLAWSRRFFRSKSTPLRPAQRKMFSVNISTPSLTALNPHRSIKQKLFALIIARRFRAREESGIKFTFTVATKIEIYLHCIFHSRLFGSLSGLFAD